MHDYSRGFVDTIAIIALTVGLGFLLRKIAAIGDARQQAEDDRLDHEAEALRLGLIDDEVS